MLNASDRFIDYNEIEGLTFSKIDLIELVTAPFESASTENQDGMGREGHVDWLGFSEQIFNLFSIENSQPLLWVIYIQFDKDGHSEVYGIGYFDNFKIVPVKYAPTSEFETWIDALFTQKPKDSTIAMSCRLNQWSFGMPLADLLSDPEGFLRKYAPKLYRLEAEQAEKASFLESFVLLDSMRQTIDLAETEQLWRRYSQLAGINSVTNPNLLAEFDRFQSVTGFAFPPELQVIYKQSDGAKGGYFGLDLLSIDDVIKEWLNWQSIYDQWSLSELTGNSYADGEKTLGMYINPNRVPLIDNVSGNFFGVDLMPGPGGKLGQIIAFGADTDTISVLANNVNHFLSRAIERIEKSTN